MLPLQTLPTVQTIGIGIEIEIEIEIENTLLIADQPLILWNLLSHGAGRRSIAGMGRRPWRRHQETIDVELSVAQCHVAWISIPIPIPIPIPILMKLRLRRLATLHDNIAAAAGQRRRLRAVAEWLPPTQ